MDLKKLAEETSKHIDHDIVFFDIETTGVDLTIDETIQFAGIRVNKNQTFEYFNTLIKPSKEIPKEVEEITKITNEMVKDMLPFKAHAKKIATLLSGADVGGFNNARFDVVILNRELTQAGYPKTMNESYIIDVYLKFINDCSRKLSDAYKYYLGKELVGAHDAGVDISATVEIFIEQAKRSNKSSRDISKEFLTEPSKRIGFGKHIEFNEAGKAVWCFGKNKGKLIESDLSYAKWVANSDFPVEVKEYLNERVL